MKLPLDLSAKIKSRASDRSRSRRVSTSVLHGLNFTRCQAHVCHPHPSAFRGNSENGANGGAGGWYHVGERPPQVARGRRSRLSYHTVTRASHFNAERKFVSRTTIHTGERSRSTRRSMRTGTRPRRTRESRGTALSATD